MSRTREDFPSSSSSSSLLRPLHVDSEEDHEQYREAAQPQSSPDVGQQQQQGLPSEPQQQESCFSIGGYDHVRRTCFICLEGAKRSKSDRSKRRDLHSCCTQCFVVVHKNCWAAYRRRQQLAAFRARLLGQRAPTPHLCSICRTGRAGMTGDAPLLPRGAKRRRSSAAAEEEAAGAGEEAVAGRSRGRNSTVLQEQLLASLGRLLQEDDEDPDRPPLCTGICMCVNTGLLVAVLLVDLLLMAFTYVYPLQVLLISLFVCYNAIVIQILVLAIRQRREYMRTYLAAETGDLESSGASDASSSSGSSGGRRGHEEESRTESGAADDRSRRRSFGEAEYSVYVDEGSREDEAAGGGRDVTETSPGHMLRSVFFSFPLGSSSSGSGARRHGDGSSSSSTDEWRQHGNSSSSGRSRRSSHSTGSSRRETLLRVAERDSGNAGWRIGELWTATKRIYFTLLRDAWGWTERNTSAMGEPLATGNRREIEIISEETRGGRVLPAAAEYYTRAEPAVEPHLPADVEMQVLDFDAFSAAQEPHQLYEIFAESS